MSQANKTRQVDHDGLWKKVITDLFEPFIAFTLPSLYPEIDFSKGVVFIEQEFPEIIRTEGKQGNAYTDKIAKAWRKDGKIEHIFIHIEIQSWRDPELPSRMFMYFYRIRDRYKMPATALAIYAHYDVPEVYDRYIYENHGVELTFKFNARRIKDYPKEELLASDNPFAIVILAAQYMNETKGNHNKRLFFKKKLFSLLAEKGYSKTESAQLLIFIKFIVKLPKELELEFENHIKKDSKMLKSAYIKEYTDNLNKEVYGESINDLKAARKQAEAERKQAEDLRKQAEDLRKQEEDQRKQAEDQRKQAENQRKQEESYVSLFVLKSLEMGMTVNEIAKTYNIPLERINEIAKK